MRILLITNKCPPDFDGGYELRAFQIALALRNRGHHVDIVTSRFRETYTGERTDPSWVHRIFRYVDVSRTTGLRRVWERITHHVEGTTVARENVPALARFLRGKSWDICYAFGLLRISFAVLEPVTEAGIPVLHHAGGTCIADHFYHWPQRIFGYAWVMQAFSRGWYRRECRTDRRHVAWVSTFLRDRSAERGFVADHGCIISRGIDFALGTDLDRPRTTPATLFMACRIDPSKGVHVALAAAGLLHRRQPELPWILEIAGESIDPEYRRQVDGQILREGLSDRVRLLGRLPHAEVQRRMRVATAFIFASVYGEPFSSTIIECMGSGTPLIGADDGSILEVVEPGVSALVYPKLEPGALSRHMEAVLTNPALALRLAAAGVETVGKHYTLERIIDRTEETMAAVILDSRKPGLSPLPAHQAPEVINC